MNPDEYCIHHVSSFSRSYSTHCHIADDTVIKAPNSRRHNSATQDVVGPTAQAILCKPEDNHAHSKLQAIAVVQPGTADTMSQHLSCLDSQQGSDVTLSPRVLAATTNNILDGLQSRDNSGSSFIHRATYSVSVKLTLATFTAADLPLLA